MIWQSDRVFATDIWPYILLQGLRVDLIQLGLMVIIPLMLMPFFAHEKAWGLWKKFTYVWVICSVLLLVFLELLTPGYIAEYSTRPNRLLIEYLKYPREVLAMLWNGFRVHVITVLLASLLAFRFLVAGFKPWLNQARPTKQTKQWYLLPVVIVIVIFSVRATTVHRPANPAYFAITSDTLVNNLILNSTWSLFHAIYSLKHENKSSEIYGKMTQSEVLQHVYEMQLILEDSRQQLNNQKIPTLKKQLASVKHGKPLNLVIILQESLGATFVKSLGGLDATPELEKLKEEGWWFDNLYATGTRSVRGIEAVVSGYLPTPAQSVVKLSGAQDNFFTLAQLLNTKGYLNEFIYGGESHFDNMRTFFVNNGFENIVDEKDYIKPVFVGSWGVSDEDLFNKTHTQLMQHHKENQAFFTLVFTSSNHSPFEFPSGRIQLTEQPKSTEKNAVRYADYAMGNFFKRAKQSPYWQNTLFLVVADHDIRVRGDALIPIQNFHIPGLILGADISPRIISTLASQVDLPTTMISLMGVDAIHPMIGRDLSSEPTGLKGRAMMQYEDNYAWLEGNQLVVLRPNKPPTHAQYNFKTNALKISTKPKNSGAIEKRALAHALLPSILYRDKLYRLPSP
jgi:phosphoglycerol transferase MdoB-like AlkP superfamily enzyme